MTSKEKLEKAVEDVMINIQESVRQKIVQSKTSGLIKVSDEELKTLLSITSGAILAAVNRSRSSFERSTSELLK